MTILPLHTFASSCGHTSKWQLAGFVIAPEHAQNLVPAAKSTQPLLFCDCMPFFRPMDGRSDSLSSLASENPQIALQPELTRTREERKPSTAKEKLSDRLYTFPSKLRRSGLLFEPQGRYQKPMHWPLVRGIWDWAPGCQDVPNLLPESQKAV